MENPKNENVATLHECNEAILRGLMFFNILSLFNIKTKVKSISTHESESSENTFPSNMCVM